MQIFALRSKPHNIERINEFLKDNFVAIGWTETDDLTLASKEEIRHRLESLGYSGQSLSTNLGMVHAFVNTAKESDIVLIRQKEIVHIGELGPYYWNKDYINEYMAHTRPIKWLAHIPFEEMNAAIQSLLKNIRTICRFKGSLEEAEITKFINGIDNDLQSGPDRKNINEELVSSTLETLKELMDHGKDESVRLEAAKELLKYLKK